MRVADTHRFTWNSDYLASRGATVTGVLRVLVIAIPNDAVADADAGDAMSGAVREDDTYIVTSAGSRKTP